ncbi:MAG: hypothetical protein R2705_10855 [Ilumatobacteraceae bacterium]
MDAAVSLLTYSPPAARCSPVVGHGVALPVPVEAATGAFACTDDLAEVDLDLAPVLAVVSRSIRRRFVSSMLDADGAVLAADPPFQFDPTTPGASSGRLTIVLDGLTLAGVTRRFDRLLRHLPGTPPARLDDQVSLTTGEDEGQSAYLIEASRHSWYFQDAAGGFSSLLDSTGNDWISYSTGSRRHR